MKVFKMSAKRTDAIRSRFAIRTLQLLFSVANLVSTARCSTIKSFETVHAIVHFRYGENMILLVGITLRATFIFLDFFFFMIHVWQSIFEEVEIREIERAILEVRQHRAVVE